MNLSYRRSLPGTGLDYFDARAAVEALQAGAWAGLPYTARVHAENLVRRADPAHRTFGRFFHEEIALPLGIEFYIGLPSDIPDARLARVSD